MFVVAKELLEVKYNNIFVNIISTVSAINQQILTKRIRYFCTSDKQVKFMQINNFIKTYLLRNNRST